MSVENYESFLRSKALVTPSVGFKVDEAELSPELFPFQRATVKWALAKGRAAVFADCGLGKSFQQLEWARLVAKKTGGRVLILAPLAVAAQTVREGARFGIRCAYAKSPSEIGDERITVTNYERLDAFLPWDGAGVVLDESSILKAYDGKTRTQIIDAFRHTPFKLAATATPAPNDFMELGNHAEFLGVMRREEMLATFFTHDGGDTSKWRLKGHAEREFWRWMCGWSVMLRKPSDLGFDDTGFALPELRFVEHVVPADHSTASQMGMLFNLEARTLQERRNARRASTEQRVRLAADIVAAQSSEPWLIWCNLNAEGDALEQSIDGAVQVTGADDPEEKTSALLDFAEGRSKILVSKPSIAGFGLNFQRCARVLFVGLSDSYEELYQAVRRCWRFGQTRVVECHIVISEVEGAVLQNIKRKEADAERMAAAMVQHMSEFQNLSATSRMTTDYKPHAAMALPSFVGGAA